MPIVTKNTFSIESHPWNWHIPYGASKLLIGTFPTEARNRKHDFFYSSSTNRFWEVAATVAEVSYTLLNSANAVEERKRILKRLKLGLTDMGKVIYRQQGSSKDHGLFPKEFMNIFHILETHTSINTIFLSGSGQSNSSLNWFSIFCDLNQIALNIKELEKYKSTQMNIAGRKVQVKLLYSPSRLSRVKTEKLIAEYRSAILNR